MLFTHFFSVLGIDIVKTVQNRDLLFTQIHFRILCFKLGTSNISAVDFLQLLSRAFGNLYSFLSLGKILALSFLYPTISI
jgi:hypothetical protein